MKAKTCRQCGLLRPFSLFYSKPGGLFGFDSICKKCISHNKHKQYSKKITAKQKQIKSRSTLLDVPNVKTEIVAVKVDKKKIMATLSLLTEAINNQALKIWDGRLWEKKVNRQEDCKESLMDG